MDAERFDAFARSLASRLSRRVALRGAVASGVASFFAGAREVAPRAAAQEVTPTPLPVCSDPARPGVGCACVTGVDDACGPTTLLCCPTDPTAPPGSRGICTPGSVGCNPRGPLSPTCIERGCRCDGSVEGACADGLVCCSDDPAVPYGPGHCVRRDACHRESCSGEGCACNSGDRHACDEGMICCAGDPSLAESPGRCEDEVICLRHQCQATANPCPSNCATDDYCQTCCSGYCGADGRCAPPRCNQVGCPCRGGVDSDCAAGLVCCQSQMTAPNYPGGPGMCATRDGCGGGDGSAVAPEATPVA